MPIVSVIVPCFNSSNYLKKTLDSVRHQTFEDWECIVVNDGSIDDTELIAQRFCDLDPRYKYISQTNSGVSVARNQGIKEACGKFIQLLDSDDLMAKDKLSSAILFLDKHPQVDVAYSGSRYFHSDRPDKLFIYGRNNLIGTIELTMYDKDVLRSVLVRNPFITSAPLYRKSVFDRVGKYDETTNYLEDWDFQIRCALQNICFHYLGYHPDTAILVRLHNTSLMNNRKEVVLAKQQLYLKYEKLFLQFSINKKKIASQKLKSFVPPILFKAFKKLK